MLTPILITVWAILASAQVNYPDPYILCGANSTAQCPIDTYCVPDLDICTDLARCPATCVYKNKYQLCGGNGIHPVQCDDSEVCIDDPRNPYSCGQACDGPGVCLPKELTPCDDQGSGSGCEEGLWCYAPRENCDPDYETCYRVCL